MTYIVDKDNVDVRLDRFLRKNCINNSMSEIYSSIRKGYVKINSKKKKENYRLKLEDEIYISNLDFKLVKNKEISNNIDKNLIFYEDSDLLIIDKPKGIAIHKGTDNDKGLAEILNVDFANRLDKKTSGLVIAAKNKKTLREITKLIRENKIIKKYKVKCISNNKYKVGDSFVIENKLEETDKKVIVSNKGKISKTKYNVLDIKDNIITLEAILYTGRKHQIRVQLANVGLSIIGDDKYGNYKKEDELELECYYLEFNGKVFEKK
ncbi:RluA family pseudouridine synthase [Oceanivirga miroungae]|uniref:Pseudouridine synthase n=1 Tax=Oceanivirga miroungae TaxID=1130046 RepID=A0A6I8M5F5_9FUSO|nr:RluA family pseudouridine synthase [Oceanivirga miroungae]VWL85158.1 pseudouridine synthase [Oceanivirga miroungae]